MKKLFYMTIILTFIISLSGCFYSVPKEFEQGSIAGIAQGPDLKGISGVQVTIVGTENVAYTDDTGTFFFGELEPGSYTLSFYKEGFPTQQKNITVAKGQSKAVMVEMSAGQPGVTGPVNVTDNNSTNNEHVHMLYVANAGPAPKPTPDPYGSDNTSDPWGGGEYGVDTSGGGIQELYLMLKGYDPVKEAYQGMDPNLTIEEIQQSIQYHDKKKNNVMAINTAYKTAVSIYEWPSDIRPFWVDMTDDGRLYISDSAYNISVFNTSSDNFYTATIMNVGEYLLCDMALGNSDSRLFCALGGYEPVVKVIDTTSNSYIQTIPLPRLKDGDIGQPWGIATHRNGQTAYVAMGSAVGGEVVFINTLSNSIQGSVTVGQNPFGLDVTPDGKKLYVANNNSATVSVVDTVKREVISTIQVGLSPLRVAVTPDGSKVFVTNKASNTVSIIDTNSDILISNLPVGKEPVGVAISRDGKMAYVANSGSDDISMIDISKNAVISHTIPFKGGNPFDLAVK